MQFLVNANYAAPEMQCPDFSAEDTVDVESALQSQIFWGRNCVYKHQSKHMATETQWMSISTAPVWGFQIFTLYACLTFRTFVQQYVYYHFVSVKEFSIVNVLEVQSYFHFQSYNYQLQTYMLGSAHFLFILKIFFFKIPNYGRIEIPKGP